MVKNNIGIESNVFIYEFNNGNFKKIIETHNTVTQTGLVYIAQRITNLFIDNDMTRQFLNLLAVGTSGTDACTIPAPATSDNVSLTSQLSLNRSSIVYQPYIVTINDKDYLDIRHSISFTSSTSWKVSLTLTSELFPSDSNIKYISEIGIFVHEMNNNVFITNKTPNMFARVTMVPFTLEENRVYVLDWYFSLAYHIS